jgi:hypothetical protein
LISTKLGVLAPMRSGSTSISPLGWWIHSIVKRADSA